MDSILIRVCPADHTASCRWTTLLSTRSAVIFLYRGSMHYSVVFWKLRVINEVCQLTAYSTIAPTFIIKKFTKRMFGYKGLILV